MMNNKNQTILREKMKKNKRRYKSFLNKMLIKKINIKLMKWENWKQIQIINMMQIKITMKKFIKISMNRNWKISKIKMIINFKKNKSKIIIPSIILRAKINKSFSNTNKIINCIKVNLIIMIKIIPRYQKKCKMIKIQIFKKKNRIYRKRKKILKNKKKFHKLRNKWKSKIKTMITIMMILMVNYLIRSR